MNNQDAVEDCRAFMRSPFLAEVRDAVHLWSARIATRRCDEMAARTVLSREERSLAAEMNARDRRRFVAGRTLLRSLLSRYLRCAPALVPITHSHEGRPACLNHASRLSFSVSHSEERIVYAVSSGRCVGVDIERLETLEDDESTMLAEAFMSESERSRLATIPASARSRSTLRYWTRKEAYFKGDISPTRRTPSEVDVSRRGEVHFLSPDGSTARAPWHVVEPPVFSAYTLAIAVATNEAETWRWRAAYEGVSRSSFLLYEGALTKK